MALELVFWVSVLGVVYPYVLYPVVLWALGLASQEHSGLPAAAPTPSVSMIVPVHNEETTIGRKLLNTAALRYPAERLEAFFVSDGATDRTVEILRNSGMPSVTIIELPVRRGKAAALNAALKRARHDILVFTDASIELQPDALERIVARFGDPSVGCVSGEDRIADAGGEGLYGRFELALRRLESRANSIVGASGSFYAQRRSLCAPFVEGMAPDFLSVLRTVEQGFLAKSEPAAIGTMSSVKDPAREFERKVRTLIRGMTALFAHRRLLNPIRYGAFSFSLVSHKVMRWIAPAFLAALLLSGAALAVRSPFYMAAFGAQAILYLGAVAAWKRLWRIDRSSFGRIALYFTAVNAASIVAWIQYLRGVRQELWTPSRR